MKGLSLFLLITIVSLQSVVAPSHSQSCSCVNGVCDCNSSSDKHGNVALSSSAASASSNGDSSMYNSAATGSTRTGNVDVQSSSSRFGSADTQDYNPTPNGGVPFIPVPVPVPSFFGPFYSGPGVSSAVSSNSGPSTWNTGSSDVFYAPGDVAVQSSSVSSSATNNGPSNNNGGSGTGGGSFPGFGPFVGTGAYAGGGAFAGGGGAFAGGGVFPGFGPGSFGFGGFGPGTFAFAGKKK